MQIDILTLFPEMFEGPFKESILKRAQEKGFLKIKIHNLRDWAKDKHHTVDDRPYGGGVGMLMMCEPVFSAVEDLRTQKSKVILLSPQGRVYNQKIAQEFSKKDHLILVCGHYEGVDERVRDHLIDDEISIGDYVLTGGEIPAMVIVDSITRLIPGVLEKEEATKKESFSLKNKKGKRLLEPPQYTRPENFRGWKVPQVLLSGNHQEVAKWREEKALEKTKNKRPDLLK